MKKTPKIKIPSKTHGNCERTFNEKLSGLHMAAKGLFKNYKAIFGKENG